VSKEVGITVDMLRVNADIVDAGAVNRERGMLMRVGAKADVDFDLDGADVDAGYVWDANVLIVEIWDELLLLWT
jgi:hypothetical protein